MPIKKKKKSKAAVKLARSKRMKAMWRSGKINRPGSGKKTRRKIPVRSTIRRKPRRQTSRKRSFIPLFRNQRAPIKQGQYVNAFMNPLRTLAKASRAR